MLEKTEARKDFLSWDDTFMLMAELISQRSKDPSTQVGAVIVNQDNVVLGLGYNGWPRNIDQGELSWQREGDFLNTKYPYVVHGEANAIYNANESCEGAKIYCGLFPCNECAKTIIQNGIKEVIYQSDKYHDEDIFIASRKLFDLAGITYRQYTPTKKLEIK